MRLHYIYIPLFHSPLERRGLSEARIKKRLQRQGWIVWRSASIGVVRHRDIYPNVRRHYERLCLLLEKQRPGIVDYLQLVASVHHGLPDFLCYRQGQFKFVECKLGYETLSERQRVCINKLQSIGFTIEVHKLVEPCTKVRHAVVDLLTGTKEVCERQLTIKQAVRYRASQSRTEPLSAANV